jgi:type IV/VI secretion system ImpK/VasF family protein
MTRSRLLNLFTPPLLRGLDMLAEVQSALAAGRHPAMRPEDATAELRRMMEERMAEARRQGPAPISHGREEEIDATRYAIVAYLDDRFGQLPGWWNRNLDPMQYTIYRERGAGDDLFNRIKVVKDQQAELKEVYATVLGLGFRGRAYAQDEAAAHLLNQSRDRVRVGLRPEPVGVADLEQASGLLMPQPYGVPAPPAPVMPKPSRWRLIAAMLAALALLLLLGAVGWWWLNRGPDGVQLGRAAMADLSCSDVRVDPVPGQRSAVILHGRYADRDALDQRLDRLRDAGVEVREGRLDERPPPICDLLGMLERRGLTTGASVPTVDAGATDGQYQIGDYFVASATSPAAGHLTMLSAVASKGSRGTISIPLPSAPYPVTAVGANARLRIGRTVEEVTSRDRGFMLVGPEGIQAIFAIWTPTPLFDVQGRPPASDPAAVIAALEAGLARQPVGSDGRPQGSVAHAVASVVPPRDAPQRARMALRGMACSSVLVLPAANGRARLAGRFASEAALEDRLAPLAGLVDRTGLRHVPEPFCQVLDQLEGILTLEGATAGGPSVATTRGDARFTQGDAVEVAATMATAFAGHLTVIQLHPTTGFELLAPSRDFPGRELAAGTVVRFTSTGLERPQRVLADPAGPRMILAIATRTPLFGDGRPLPRDQAAGLAALQAAIRAQPGGATTALATHALITVAPRTLLPRAN